MAKNDREIPDTREGPRSFVALFADLGDGDFARDASNDLFDLVNAVRDEALRVSGKVKGEMNIKLKVTIDPRGIGGIDCDITTKKPKVRRATAQAFITSGGNLTLENPRQLKLGVREVPRAEQDVQEVDTGRRAPREV